MEGRIRFSQESMDKLSNSGEVPSSEAAPDQTESKQGEIKWGKKVFGQGIEESPVPAETGTDAPTQN